MSRTFSPHRRWKQLGDMAGITRGVSYVFIGFLIRFPFARFHGVLASVERTDGSGRIGIDSSSPGARVISQSVVIVRRSSM